MGSCGYHFMLKANIAVFFFLIINLMGYSQISDKNELICLYKKKPVKVDAQANEWEHSNSISIQGKSKKSDNIAKISTLWDNQSLYFLFQVEDKNLLAEQTALDHPDLYLDDMVEFLIDTQNDKDSCWDQDDIIYHINLLGQKKDDRGSMDCITNPSWNGAAFYTIKIGGSLNDSTDYDKGYIVEVSISWKELGLKPAVGLKLGVNFAVGDNGKLFDWVGASPFRSPYAFGDLVLKK